MAGNAETNNKVEERIIAAKFDSSDFEKGVDKTIKKLDELKDNLKFEKTGESIADLSKKTKDAQESATKSIEKLTDRYTNFVGMIKQKLLSGIADQVVSVFFRMEQAALRFTKSMTFDQISAGMAKYESMLTAVRMITNSYKTIKNEITGVAEKIHYTQDEAYTAMRNLQDYADETSYSIEQMSDSMSKMVAAGVSLSQAEKNVQGIANACAAAGVNATDAARAFFNLSQAYSSGSLKYTDYRSLELLNMTNENFQEKMLEAAVKAGTLKVVKGKNGAKTYKTQKSKTNKKVTAGKTVTKQSLAESLRYGFMDKDAMDYLFGNNFYVDVNDFYDVKDQTEKLRGKEKTARRKELLSQIKDDEGVKKYIEGLKETNELKKAYKEFNTDEERKTFIDELIKDAEIIDGISKKYTGIDTNSVKEVFSKLADDDVRRVTYKGLKTEKEKKEYLKNLEENAELVQRYIDEQKKENAIVDRTKVESYIKSLGSEDERYQKYYGLEGEDQAKARSEYIDKLMDDNNTIREIQKQEINVTEQAMEEYILSLDKTNKYRQKYEKLNIEGRKKYLNELTRDADIAKKANKKDSTFDEEALKKYIESLDKTNARRAKYDKMSAAERKQYLKDMAEQAAAIGKLGRKYDDVAIEAFLAAREARNLGDVIKAVGDYVSSKWTKVFENLIGQLDDASDFFTDLSEGGIASLFTDFADWISDVSEAFNEGGVGSANFRNMIIDLDGGLGNLLGIFNDLLPNTEDFGYQLMSISADLAVAMRSFNDWTQKVRAWVTEEDRITKIQGIFANLSGVFTIVGKTFGIAFNTIAQALHVVAPILDAVFVALNKITEPIGRLGARENTEPFEKLQNAINNFFGVLAPASETAAPVIEKIGEILGIIGDFFVGGAIDTIVMNINFFADAFSLLLELLGVQTVEKKNGQSVLEGLQKDVASFAQTCKDAVKTVGEFFDSLFIDLRKLFNLEPKAGEKGVEGGGFFANIKNFFETNEFIQNAKAWLAKAKTDVEAWFNKAITDVGNWISNFPETLSNLLNQELWTEERKKTVKHDDGTEETITEEYTYTLSNIIENIKNNVIAWFNQAVEDVKKWVTELPQKISDAFTTLFYTKEKQHGNRHKRLYGEYVWVETPLKEWLDGVVDSVGKFVANIPNYILQGIDKVIDIFGLLIGAVFGTNKEDVSKEGEQSEKTASTAIHEWATNFINTLKTELRLLPARIKGFILLQKARISIAFRNIKTWFNTTETGKAIKDWTVSMVNSIKEFIVKLPEHIKDAVKAVGSLGRSIISTVKELFSGKEIADETQKELEEGVKGISLGGVLASIADIGATIVNEFVSLFSGTDSIEQNISWFVSTVGGFIISIPERIWKAVEGIGKELSGVWTYISTLLTSDSEGNDAQNTAASDFEKAHPTIANIIKGTVDYIKGLPDRIEEEVSKAADKLSRIWDVLISAVNGDSINKRMAELEALIRDRSTSPLERTEYEEELKELKGENGPIERAVASIGEYIGSIPGKLKEFSDNLAKEVSGFWPGIVGIITKNNREAELEKLIRDRSTSSLERAGYEEELRQIRIPSDFEQAHPQIAAFVTSTQKWIEGIPETLWSAYNTIKDEVLNFFSEFAEFWNNTINKDHGASVSSEDSDDKQATAFEQNHPMIAGWITSAVAWIKSIPDQLNAAITKAMDDITTAWGQFTEYLSVLDRRRQLEAMIPDQSLSPRERANYQKELYELNKPTAFEKEHPTIARLTETITGWVSGIPDTISSTWTSVTTAISGFWDDLVKAFRGDNITEDVGDGEESLGQRLRNAIINFFANLPKYVTDGIQTALDLINSAISGITGIISGAGAEDTTGTVTEKIKEEAENVVASLEETTEQVTNEAADSTKKMAEDASKNADSPKNGFVDGIVKIGQTLWTIITETIPGFISSGFGWLKDNWKSWSSSLFAIFTGVTGIAPEDFNLSTIKDAIVKAIKSLPDTISNAWKDVTKIVGDLFSDKKNKKKLLPAMDAAINMASTEENRKAIIDTYDKLGYDVSAYAKKSSLFDSIDSVAKEIGDAINSIFESDAFIDVSSFLLKLWNRMIEGIQKFFAMLGQWFKGGIRSGDNKMNADGLKDAVEDNYGVSIASELGEALENIGTTIFDLFTKTIPEFLGSAAGTVIKEIPNIMSAFMNGLKTALGNGVSEETSDLAESVLKDTEKSVNETVSDVDPDKDNRKIMALLLDEYEGPQYRKWLKMSKADKEAYNIERKKWGLEAFEELYLDKTTKLGKSIIAIRDADDNLYETLMYHKDKSPGYGLKSYFDYLAMLDDSVSGASGGGGSAPDTQDLAKNAEKTFNGLQGVIELLINNVVNIDKETGKVTGIDWKVWLALGVIVVEKLLGFIQSVKDIPRWSNSETVQAKNSMNGVLRVAMETLMVGAIFATAASQMNETQFNQAMTAFETVAGFVTKIAGIAGLIKGAEIVGDIAGTAADLLGGGGIGGGTVVKAGFAGFGASLAAVSAVILEVVDSAGRMLEDMGVHIHTLADSLNNTIDDVVKVAPQLDDVLKMIETIIEIFKKSGEIVALNDEIPAAQQILNDLMAPLINFAKVSTGPDVHAQEIISSITEIMGMTGKMEEFVKFVERDDGIFDRFKYAISSLGSALSFYASSSSLNIDGGISQSGIKNAVDFLKAILGDSELQGLAAQLTPDMFGGSPTEMQAATERLVIFAGGLAKLGAAAADITSDTGNNINTFVQEMSKIDFNQGLDDTEQTTKLSSVAAAMISLGTGISELTSATGSINDDAFSKIKAILGYLSDLSFNIKGFESSFFGRLFGSNGDLKSFGTTLEELGSHLKAFIEHISQSKLQEYNGDELKKLKDNISFAMDMLVQIGNAAISAQYGDITEVVYTMANYADYIVQFIATLGTIDDVFKEQNGFELGEEQFEKIHRVIELFGETASAIRDLSPLFGRSASDFQTVMDGLYKKVFQVDLRKFNKATQSYEDSSFETGFVPSFISLIQNGFGVLSDEEIAKAKAMIEPLNELIIGLSACMQSISDTGGGISFSVDPLNSTLHYFIDNFDLIKQLTDKAEGLELDKLDKARALFKGIQELGQAISAYGFSVDDSGRYNNFYQSLTSFRQLDYADLSNSISEFITGYTNILEDPANKIRLEQSGTSMAKIMATAMQTAMESDDPQYHPQITPVLNDQEIRTKMADLFGVDANMKLDFSSGFAEAVRQAFGDSETFSSMNQSLGSIDGKLDDLKTVNASIGELQSDLRNAAAAITSLQVRLDTGVLVGELTPGITALQDRYADYYVNHITTPTFSLEGSAVS